MPPAALMFRPLEAFDIIYEERSRAVLERRRRLFLTEGRQWGARI